MIPKQPTGATVASSMSQRGRTGLGPKRTYTPRKASSVASASKVQKRNGNDDVATTVFEGDTKKGGGNRRSLDKILVEEVNGKQVFPSSTQPCEMQAAPSGSKGTLCHFGPNVNSPRMP